MNHGCQLGLVVGQQFVEACGSVCDIIVEDLDVRKVWWMVGVRQICFVVLSGWQNASWRRLKRPWAPGSANAMEPHQWFGAIFQ